MIMRLLRVLTIILYFFLLTGFIPILSFIGPSVTALTSGNVYKASAQFIINKKIEEETGKNSLTFVKTFVEDEINKKNQKNSLEKDLRQLVEKRIKITRKKLNDQNIQKLVKKRIEVTRSILNSKNITR